MDYMKVILLQFRRKELLAEVQQRTCVYMMHDVGWPITELKWRCAGHLARLTNGRWTMAIAEWRPQSAEHQPDG